MKLDKIKVFLFYIMVLPMVFVFLKSDHCEGHSRSDGRSIKLWVKGREIGLHNKCGYGGTIGVHWTYNYEVYAIDAHGNETIWQKSKGDILGMGPLYTFIDVPADGQFYILMYVTSQECFSDAPGAPGCSSRCARFQRIERTDVYDFWTTEITFTNDDMVMGPCC